MFKKYTPQLDVRVAEDKESVSLSTAQKVKISIKDFFSKCEQIYSFLRKKLKVTVSTCHL